MNRLLLRAALSCKEHDTTAIITEQ